MWNKLKTSQLSAELKRCELLRRIVETETHVNTAVLQSADAVPSRRVGAHSLLSRSL